MESLCYAVTRKKPVHESPQGDIRLHRCLTTFDLTLMAIGSMVGSGIYIATGVAAKEMAGPAMSVSYLVSAIAMLLVAACFMEFAGRVNRTGSTYLFMYISLGELPAFLMGFSLLTGQVLSSATNGRAWSAYLDFLVDGAIANFTETHIAHWETGSIISPYPNLLAFGIIAFVTIILALGAQCTAKFNAVFASLNVLTLVFVIIVGFIFADIKNWKSEGGFAPYGFSGIVAGSGAAFWALSGYENLCVCTEEAKEPKKSIPRATGIAIFLVTLLYVGTTAAVTLVTSYANIDLEAPLPSAFAARGINWAKYVVSVGPLLGLTTTLLNSIFGGVRLMYAMAVDGLLPSFLSWVNPKTRVPVAATLVLGGLGSILSIFFEIADLLGFGIVLLLVQYIVIAATVIILRYRPPVNTCAGTAENGHGYDLDVNQHGLDPDSSAETHQRATEHRKYVDNTNESSSMTQPLISSNGRREARTQSMTSSSLSDSDEYDPSLDIRKNYPNAINSDIPRDNHVSGRTFLAEDLEGDGFTTTEDEMVLFDVRKMPQPQSYKPTQNVSNHSNNINNIPTHSNDDEDGAEEGRNSTRLRNNTAHSVDSETHMAKVADVGHLKTRFRFLESIFQSCRGWWVPLACVLLLLAVTVFSILLFYPKHQLEKRAVWLITLVCVLAFIMVILVASIAVHQQSRQELAYRMSCVPVLPSVAILVCSALMFANATLFNFLGCLVLLVLGLVLYFSYGMRHSKLGAASADKHSPGGDTSRLLGENESEDEL